MIDLHLHLDGSLSVRDAAHLATLNGVELPTDIKGSLCVSETYTSLTEYLEKFDLPLKLLSSPDAVKYAVRSLLMSLAEEGIIYAEIRFAPALHTGGGAAQRDIVLSAIEGLTCGKEEFGISANLLLCCMRGEGNIMENLETVKVASEFLGKGVAAIDLAGDESKYPTKNFEYIFSEARAKNIPITVHAGEASGAQSVLAALRAGAVRIGHGVRAVSSPETVKMLKERCVTLELCPTSNIQTGAVSDFDAYPLKKFLDLGVTVTVNTDNKTVSDTTLRKEYMLVKDTLGLSDEELLSIALTAADSAFVCEKEKDRLKSIIKKDFFAWLYKDSKTLTL